MLRHLRIQNMALIESCDVSFERGLNIISGESGAGKSSLMAAFSVALGQKADKGLIRKGTDKALVEVAFDIAQPLPILEEAGIEHDPAECLILRRTLEASGKGRCFINDQMVNLPLLQEVASCLVDVVGQHAHTKLHALEQHRLMLDLFGSVDTERMKELYRSFQSSQKELDELVATGLERAREIDAIQQQLTEIAEAKIKDQEDDELFAEFSRLQHADELAQGIGGILQILQEAKLKSASKALSRLAELDSSLNPYCETLASAQLELSELGYSLERYAADSSANPRRLAELDERLTLINRLKRKYGASCADIVAYVDSSKARLAVLDSADSRIAELQAALASLQELCDKEACQLTDKRSKAAKSLAKQMTERLRKLGMPNATFSITISPKERTASGDDAPEFFLAPNLGESSLPVRSGVSGGELSRVMLALKTILAAKEAHGTVLVFDEIDTGLGGETATFVAESLHETAKARQVLCITHLAQVASLADHHLSLEKIEAAGRTHSIVRTLTASERPHEIKRMLGGRLASLVG